MRTCAAGSWDRSSSFQGHVGAEDNYIVICTRLTARLRGRADQLGDGARQDAAQLSRRTRRTMDIQEPTQQHLGEWWTIPLCREAVSRSTRGVRRFIPARISPDLQPPEAAPATEAAEMCQHLCGWVLSYYFGKGADGVAICFQIAEC